MNTSEFNSTLQPGEKAVGSGAGAEQKTRFSPQSDAPDGKTFGSVHDWKAAMHHRKSHPPVFKGGNAAAHAAMTEVVARGLELDAANPEPDAQGGQAADPNNPDGLAWLDPWDLPANKQAAARQYDPNDPLAPYREGKGVPLEMPEHVQNFSEQDASNLSDFSFVAAREGWSKEFAQSIVDQVAADFLSEKSRPGPEGSYDPERTVSEMRFEFGEETEAVLGRVEAYCARRPALSAYLDATGLGNSPSVIRMLAAVASDESIITKEGAKKFIDNLGKNESYWQGDKLELAKAKIAFTVLG
jgi:hypothetical protein